MYLTGLEESEVLHTCKSALGLPRRFLLYIYRYIYISTGIGLILTHMASISNVHVTSERQAHTSYLPRHRAPSCSRFRQPRAGTAPPAPYPKPSVPNMCGDTVGPCSRNQDCCRRQTFRNNLLPFLAAIFYLAGYSPPSPVGLRRELEGGKRKLKGGDKPTPSRGQPRAVVIWM